MSKIPQILIPLILIIAVSATNLHFFAYTHKCNTKKVFEITTTEHKCSVDCCNLDLELESSSINSCCNESSQEYFDISMEDNCCATNVIYIENRIDLQSLNVSTHFNIPITFLRMTLFNSIHNILKNETLAKDYSINLPPPKEIISQIAFTKLIISQDDDDQYC